MVRRKSISTLQSHNEILVEKKLIVSYLKERIVPYKLSQIVASKRTLFDSFGICEFGSSMSFVAQKRAYFGERPIINGLWARTS